MRTLDSEDALMSDLADDLKPARSTQLRDAAY